MSHPSPFWTGPDSQTSEVVRGPFRFPPFLTRVVIGFSYTKGCSNVMNTTSSDVNKQTPNENKILVYSGVRLTPQVNSVTMHKESTAKICVLKKIHLPITFSKL